MLLSSFVCTFRPISTANVGRQMLKKMGWNEGEGLGREGAGRREPVRMELFVEMDGNKFSTENRGMIGLLSI